ncbi:hypothetical protein [Deinococcus aquaticus]|uniref:AAA+ ATPase domain-containing protein n=1 Tax=Deinococcus aquaticus TaxID=328692 RepID=A0ABY7V6G3_9DEIO|nr:hypothetical protein [Deinococcus aquaticus]WDA60798.1 hypothetical protein M8445_18005 [Deinococcus aquaticus]
MGAQSGGAAAIRGFRLQTYYILRRVLTGSEDHYRPEGAEDLLRLSPEGKPLEHVQVKSYGNNLTIAALASRSGEGEQAEPPYLRRVLDRLHNGDQAQETLVVVGQFGPQMRKAWQGDGHQQERIRVTLRRHGYSDAEVDLLFERLTLEEIVEAEQDQQIANFLQEGITAGDIQTARSVLAWWLFELSEQPTTGLPNTITPHDLHVKLQQIGRATTELRGYHQEWGTSLVPLMTDDLRNLDAGDLRRELYEGVGARLEHILANVDLRRESPLEALRVSFQERPLVVVHGASGQGKTALAYRYLADEGLLPLSYRLGRLHDVTQGQQVLQAVQAFLRQHRSELYLLIDVEPGDREWLDLLKNARGIQNLRVLLTIREEDWTRNAAELAQLSPSTLHLTFGEVEARHIFNGLQQVRVSREFMRFEEAWNAFREEGPLLEFVFMVTHKGQQLQARLQEQVARLLAEWINQPRYPGFLHAAAFAAAAHAAVDARRLAEQFGLSMLELKSILLRLNEEHLLRQDGGVIRGLHAIRSDLLLELLGDPDFMPKHEAFTQVLPAVVEDDLELLALNALIWLPPTKVLDELRQFQPTTWVGRTGLTRALIWHSIREYVGQAKPAIQSAFQEFEFGWWLFVSPDLLNLRGRQLVHQLPDWDELSFFSASWKKKLKERRAAFHAYDLDLRLVGEWLGQQGSTLPQPSGVNDWLAAAELSFYSSFWPMPLESFEVLRLEPVADLPLFDAAEVFYGLSFVSSVPLRERLGALHRTLIEQFTQAGNIGVLQVGETSVAIHYAVPDDDALNPVPGPNPHHEGKSIRVEILHFLYPEKEKYVTQGYGHQSLLVPEQSRVDETVSGIARETFPPRWGTQWNRTFHQLAEMDFLLPDWQAHAEHHWETRRAIVDDLRTLVQLLPRSQGRMHEWFSGSDRRTAVFIHALRAHVAKRVGHRVLPRSAVDPWGLAMTSSRAVRDRLTWPATVQVLSKQLQADHYDQYFQASRKYGDDMNTFFRQAAEGIFALSKLHVSRDEEVRFRHNREGLLRSLRLSKFNLHDATLQLPEMQATFRTAFAHLFPAADLEALECDEQEVCRALDDLWPDFARVPPIGQHHGIQTTSSDVQSRYRLRLREALSALRQEGLQAKLLDTEERWKDQQPTLWITVEISALRTLFDANEAIVQALARLLTPLDSVVWTMDVLRHQWAHIVVIPTRYGRAIPQLAWHHTPDMVTNLDGYFWRQQPIEIPVEQLGRLGLKPWLLTQEPWIVDTLEKTLACLGAANRSAGLHDLLELEDLPAEAREALKQSALDVQTQHLQALQEALERGPYRESGLNKSVELQREFSVVRAEVSQRTKSRMVAEQVMGRPPQEHELLFADMLYFLSVLNFTAFDAMDRQIREKHQKEWFAEPQVIG